MERIVQMERICKSYKNKRITNHVLKSITVDIYEKEFVAITGPSGCGKSTFLSVLGLMDSADSGTYMLTDILATRLKKNEQAYIRNKHIGFVFQSFNLIDNLTVFDNIALPLSYRNYSKSEIKLRTIDALSKVGLENRINYMPNQLSGGQQQRVSIARAIVGSPDLLLVDEPTGNLDSKSGDKIMQLLTDLNNSGATIIMVTHDVRYISCVGRQLQMLDGEIVAEQNITVANNSQLTKQA